MSTYFDLLAGFIVGLLGITGLMILAYKLAKFRRITLRRVRRFRTPRPEKLANLSVDKWPDWWY